MTFCNEQVDQDEPDRETIVGAIRLLEESLAAKKRQLEKYDSVHHLSESETCNTVEEVKFTKFTFPSPREGQHYWAVPGVGYFDLEGNFIGTGADDKLT